MLREFVTAGLAPGFAPRLWVDNVNKTDNLTEQQSTLLLLLLSFSIVMLINLLRSLWSKDDGHIFHMWNLSPHLNKE